MARVVIKDNLKIYYNDDNLWHREDGPAYIDPHGYWCWYLNHEPQMSLDSSGNVHFWIDPNTKIDKPNGFKMMMRPDGEILWPALP